MKIVTAAEMREIDRVTTARLGVPSLTLMENAGTAVAKYVLSAFPGARRIGVICGKGNNGGDGFVAARKLREQGREVEVLLLADPAELRGDAAQMYKRMPAQAVVARSPEELAADKAQHLYSADLLLDAILGTGFRPPVSGLYAAAIERMWKSDAPVVAVDIPSGADADAMGEAEPSGPVAPARSTVTFTAPRPAHVFSPVVRGPVLVAHIGSPAEAIQSALNLEVITVRDILPILMPRKPDANKGSFGHVLIVGGSLGKAGAPSMAGMGALRAGAGLATIATPRSVLPTVAGFAAELMTEPLEETDAGTISLRALEYGRMDAITKSKTVLAVGPGISRNPESSEFVRVVVEKSELPVVLDADGLNAFEGRADRLNGSRRPLVLTPHPGEMARLTGLSVAEVQADRIGIARRFATEHQLLLVLKGHRTLVAEPRGTVWANTTGNPGMASGGTGDILTGITAGLCAQAAAMVSRSDSNDGERSHDALVMAVLAAVHLHGLAGDLAKEAGDEHSLTATDLLSYLPHAFRALKQRASDELVRVA